MTMSESANSIDKGMAGIVAAETNLSDVRGELGELVYCGYNINDLAENATFEEVVHLLHRGHLPNADELSALKREFVASRKIPEGVIDVLKALPKDTAPMHALRTGVSALGCFDTTAETNDDLEAVRKKSIQLILKA